MLLSASKKNRLAEEEEKQPAKANVYPIDICYIIHHGSRRPLLVPPRRVFRYSKDQDQGSSASTQLAHAVSGYKFRMPDNVS
jgi:hypothetical protein